MLHHSPATHNEGSQSKLCVWTARPLHPTTRTVRCSVVVAVVGSLNQANSIEAPIMGEANLNWKQTNSISDDDRFQSSRASHVFKHLIVQNESDSSLKSLPRIPLLNNTQDTTDAVHWPITGYSRLVFDAFLTTFYDLTISATNNSC